MAAIRRRGAGLLSAAAVITLAAGVDIKPAPTAMADPPYLNCDEARADGRWNIPYTDPAYQPELDPNGNGVACEAKKARRSTH